MQAHKFITGLLLLNAEHKRLEAYGTWLNVTEPFDAKGYQIASIEKNSVRVRLHDRGIVKLRAHLDSQVVITAEIPER